MSRLLAAALALAALSLLGPSEPSYDPWAWLVWGRELGAGSLGTAGGPSWKPLPVAFTALFAPLSGLDDGIPPALWIVVARTGVLMALVLAFRVAARLAGGDPRRRVLAGSVAAAALTLTPDWIRYAVHGNEAPLAVALGLLAVDRQLEGRSRTALAAAGAACLARPELAGFLLLYAGYLWVREPGTRVLAAAVLGAVAAAWLVPPWLASGDPLTPGEQARSEPSWSLSRAPVPWRAALDVAAQQLPAALAAAALAGVLLVRRRAVAALALVAAGNLALYVASTEAGFSGNPRYVLPATAAAAVLAGVGVAAVAWRAPAAAALLLLVAIPGVWAQAGVSRERAVEAAERSRLHSQLEDAVDAVGPRYIALFGPATVNRSFQTHMAWELGESLEAVHGARGRGLAFSAPVQPVAGPVRIYPRARPRTRIARVGEWTVTERATAGGHVYTWPLQGFSLRAAAGARG
jgi:hypothetical protein